MGNCKESLLNSVERDLRKAYRSEEGWRLERMAGISDAPFYVLSRRKPGSTDRVLVGVRIAAQVGAPEFECLRETATACAGKGMPVNGALLVVPQNVSLSADPGDIGLFHLTTYSVKDKEVLWSKSTLWRPDGSFVLEEET